jgi:hypothetical protein
MNITNSERYATIATVVGTIVGWAWVVSVLSNALVYPALV